MTTYKLMQLGGKSPKLTTEQINYLTKLFNWYADTNQTELPLKPIKHYFKEWKNIDDDMDFFVKAGFLERYDRRYRFLNKELPVSDVNTLSEAKLLLDESLKEFEESIIVAAINRYYNGLNLSFFSRQSDFSYTIPSSNQGIKYLFQDTLSSEGFGLAGHFSQKQKSAISEQITDLTGDVNQSFFIDMSGAVITTKALELNRKIKEPNLFLTVLRQLEYFNCENDTLAHNVLYVEYTEAEFDSKVKVVSKLIESYFEEVELETNTLSNDLNHFMVLEQYLTGLDHSKQVIRFI